MPILVAAYMKAGQFITEEAGHSDIHLEWTYGGAKFSATYESPTPFRKDEDGRAWEGEYDDPRGE
jgi:hypothetical protein